MSMEPRAKHEIKHMTYAAVCLALAIVLPFVAGHIPQIGKMLCPMHLPVLLCGFITNPWWALAVGFIAPILRHFLFAMPPYPSFAAMAFELAVYGLVSGILYRRLPAKKGYIYITLLSAMVLGRVVSGIAMAILLQAGGGHYTFAAFIAANVTTSIPGIILQIILIPVLVMILEKAGIAHRHRK